MFRAMKFKGPWGAAVESSREEGFELTFCCPVLTLPNERMHVV